MSNSNLTSYNFHNSNIRVEQNDKGEVLFCLADVCASLNLAQSNKTANQIKEEFGSTELNSALLKDANNHGQQCTMITEPQLYFVMMRSNSKIAREFRQWICNEVLPEIRKRGAYVGNEIKNEVADKEAKNYDWYIGQLTELFEKNKVSKEVLVSTINIAQRVFKTGYVVALKNTADNQDKSKADEKVTLTEDEITAIDHMVYYHDKFRPDTLKACKKIAEIQAQATKLLLTIQDIPSAQLYESATAPDISAQRLKRFNTTKVKKGELVVSA
jgi:prophage antirepressor-like protein